MSPDRLNGEKAIKTRTIKQSTGLSRIAPLLSLVILRAFLDIVYLYYILPFWGYMGYDYEPNAGNLLISLAQLILVGFVLPVRIVKPTDIAIVLLAALVLLPFQTFSVWGGGSKLQIFAPFLAFLVLAAVSKGPQVRIPPIRQGPKIFEVLSFVTVFFYLALFVARGGLAHFNLDIGQVYDFRELQKEQVQSGFLQAYLANWIYKIVLPTLTLYQFVRKRYAATAILLLTSLLFFGMSNHKTTVVFPLLAIGLWFLLARRPTSTQIIFGFLAIFSLSIGFAILLGDHLLASFIVRRAIFVAALNFAHYESFFATNPFIFWSNSVMSPFLDYSYDLSTGRVISQFVGSDDNANSGFLASGYMHAGLFGILLYSLLLAFFLRFLDVYARPENAKIVTAVIAAPILHAYLNVDLLNAFNTHGLLLLAVLIYLAFGVQQGPLPRRKQISLYREISPRELELSQLEPR